MVHAIKNYTYAEIKLPFQQELFFSFLEIIVSLFASIAATVVPIDDFQQ